MGFDAFLAISAYDIAAWPYSVGILINGCLSFGLFISLWVAIWEVVVFLTLICSFCMSNVQERGSRWKKLCLDFGGLVAQFPCWLFHLVQALMFGALVGSFACLPGACLVPLVLTLAGFVVLVGKDVVWPYISAEGNCCCAFLG